MISRYNALVKRLRFSQSILNDLLAAGGGVKKLYITTEQAKQLGDDLLEYSKMQDSSDRGIFKGFKISFGDMLAEDLQPEQGFEMTPIPEFTEISADSDT